MPESIAIAVVELGRKGGPDGQPLPFQVKAARRSPCEQCAERVGCRTECGRFQDYVLTGR